MFNFGNKAATPASNGGTTSLNFGGSNTQQAGAAPASTGFTFGAKPTTTAATGFGSTAQPSATATTGFGSTAQPATTPSFSLGGQQSNNTASTGLSFGAKPAATTTGFSLGGQQSNNTASTGLSFGAKPAATTTGFSLGGQQPNNTASTGLSFGAKPAATTTNTFGSAQQQSNTAADDEKTFLAKIEESKSKIPQKSKINRLLDGCHLLPTNESLESNVSYSDLNVRITPSLNELCESTNLLNQKLSKAGPDLTRAHYLLSGSGFNIQEAEQFIEDLKKVSKAKRLNKAARSVNARTNAANKRNSSVNETVLDNYLRDKKQEQILSSIEKSLNDSSASNPLLLDNTSYAKKKDELKTLYGINSVTKGKTTTKFDETNKKSGLSFFDETFSEGSISRKSKNAANKKMALLQTFNNCKINVNSSQTLRKSFEEYAKIVYKNNSKKNDADESLTDMILKYVSSNNETLQSNNRHISECLEILKFQENPEIKDLSLNKKSQKFLEAQFHKYILDFYAKNSINEGIPTIANKYQHYISMKFKNLASGDWKSSNLTIVNDKPIWCIMYYFLRGGCLNEAYSYIISNKTIFNKIAPQISQCFKHIIQEGYLDADLQQRILLEYKTFNKEVNVDPYKLAVYKIIGKLDLSGETGSKCVGEVIESMEDWVWFHLAVLTKGQDESKDIYKVRESSDQFTFQEFKEIVILLGEQQFGLKLYLQVLLLCGLYENMAEFISNDKSRFNIDTVHLIFAIHNSVSLDLDQFAEVGLPIWKFFTSYMQYFIISDPKIVIEYLILFYRPISVKNKDSNKKILQLTQSLIKDLISYSKDYTAILGKVNLKTGSIQQGYLEKRASFFNINSGTELYSKITESCAFKAEEEGRFEDAILLYHLANNLDSVFTIVNKSLGDFLSGLDFMHSEDSISSFELQSQDINSILNKAILINENYANYGSSASKKISSENKLALPVLLSIADIWQRFIVGDYAKCLDKLRALNLVPIYDTSENATFVILSQGKEMTSLLNIDPVLKNLSNVLILTMFSIQQLKEKMVTLRDQSESIKEQTKRELNQISKNCMTYVGITPYRLSKQTYTTLLSIESELYK
ncbi:linker nucleoporin [Hanseniaspora uvarum]|nr:linker nucleoporin [Hanseniaspora uvarum]